MAHSTPPLLAGTRLTPPPLRPWTAAIRRRFRVANRISRVIWVAEVLLTVSSQYDDLAELEWLSNFVEESFSSEDLQKLQLISGMKTRPDESSESGGFQPVLTNQMHNVIHNGDTEQGNNNNNPIFHPDMSVPAKARSKRSRAAPCNWASRLLVLSPTTSSSEPDIVVPVQPTPANQPGKKPVKTKKKDGGEGGGLANSDGRKCLHCATDKTPQWRTGPMGPKTLCNACGVRYKSGRLVPEYRPAASPTFVLTKHSNSHRKVLELRRQKEMLRAQHQHQQQFMQQHHHQNMVFDVPNGDDYLTHQHVGPEFRQLI
ncbi:GATA transcription factor 12 isoform X2 [Herrania umbratica]|uniref:GATA transcription factor 12 isoform X2 n=1 Tax=Herrania umbratica TaxID=108875 RepID=A0A6J0ZN35_9ROSI|nr:GATA transcription factor 12 isoform X2 [Herrania umbratica]